MMLPIVYSWMSSFLCIGIVSDKYPNNSVIILRKSMSYRRLLEPENRMYMRTLLYVKWPQISVSYGKYTKSVKLPEIQFKAFQSHHWFSLFIDIIIALESLHFRIGNGLHRSFFTEMEPRGTYFCLTKPGCGCIIFIWYRRYLVVNQMTRTILPFPFFLYKGYISKILCTSNYFQDMICTGFFPRYYVQV